MALQTTGAISISDAANEFSVSNPASLSDFYGVADGIPTSGAISLSDFYGASSGPVTGPFLTEYAIFYGGEIADTTGYTPTYAAQNILTRIQYTGSSVALVGSETSIGTVKKGSSGGTVSNKAVFTCGYDTNTTNLVRDFILTDSTGALLSSSTSANGYSFPSFSGASVDGDRATYLNGGYSDDAPPGYNYWWYTDDSLVVVASTSIGTYRHCNAGAGINSKALFHSGFVDGNTPNVNTLTRSNRTGELIAEEASLGQSARCRASAGVNLTALFYGGNLTQGNQSLDRFDEDGALLSSVATLANTNSNQYRCAGGLSNVANPVMVIYGGNYINGNTATNNSVAISEEGVILTGYAALGTSRHKLGGGSSN